VIQHIGARPAVSLKALAAEQGLALPPPLEVPALRPEPAAEASGPDVVTDW